MSKRTKFLLAIGVIATLIFGLQIAAYANHTVSLTGSNFEIEDSEDPDGTGPKGPLPPPPGANLTVEHTTPPSLDWVNVDEIRVTDAINGTGDNSFGEGSKEDDPDPTVVEDGIPPNKSDLRNFGVYLETNANGRFLNVFWHRVQDPSGTTNMDFEFNANVCPHADDDSDPSTPEYDDDGVDGIDTPTDTTGCSDNNLTPERVAGDVLIQYDLTNGGTRPELFLSEWVATGNKSLCEAANSTPCWGDRINLTDSGDAAGSINNVDIVDLNTTPVDETDGINTGGSISARTFGEAQIDFDTIAGSDPCVGFGSAYLKSRSSDSFTAAMKDFTPPEELNFNECGAIEITKTKKHAAAPTNPLTQPHAGVEFTITGSGLPAAGTKVTTDANGKACLANLQIGNTYSVTETVPTNYAADGQTTKQVTVSNTGTCASGATGVSFANTPLTNITVSVDSLVPGGTGSTIDCDAAADPPFDKTVLATSPDNGDGSLTLSNKLPGTYTCTIVVDP